MIGFIRCSRSLSKTFDIVGKSDIGLYDEIACGGFPGFGTMTTSATFQHVGIYFNENEALINEVSPIVAL